ncbi:MAG: hypothetical protein JST21_09530 [Bacteroidetes bacterium]|nr:hypothetical protein [Bacteroidota bacterium]
MLNKRSNIIIILLILGLSWVISYPMNEWFSETMLRHQLLQLPAMLALGIFAGFWFSKYFHISFTVGITLLIFIMFSFIFWMLPHSIDLAVINTSFNRAMHVNMLLAGLFMIPILQSTLFEVKIIFLGMLSSMLIATGITLTVYDLLLCSSYNIAQQKETGSRFIIAGIILYAGTIFTFIRGSGKQ